MSIPTQDGRNAKLATPFGKDVLLLSRFDGAEGMGELFEFRIEALSETPDLDFDKALGRNCSIHLETHDKAGRDFSGVLTEARWLTQRGNFHVYSLVLRPWLWLLSLTSDCRIFPNMTPKDIIRQVLGRRSTDVLDHTTGNYPKREYTVQYRETDLNFVLRLMEEYGIYYYFEFERGDGDTPSKHDLVLADSASYKSLPDPTEIVYLPSTAEARADKQQFNDWTKSRAMVTGVFALNDYDYEKPGSNLSATAHYVYHFEHADMEIYNYPGDYDKADQGTKLANVCGDIECTRNLRCAASGYAPSLTPGFTINRTSANAGDSENGQYLLLRCTHAYGDQTYGSTAADDAGAVYYGGYELSKSDIQYRMPQRTHKPVIVGTQSALVVGEKGEEINVDKEGRICVQFYWNRDKSYGKEKKPPSRRVRVGQFWAGSHRGALWVPRIDDEVMIQYEDGDPDRPIVVGSVYNGTNTVTMDLPEKMNSSGILTKSTKGSNGYNMLLFNDTAGSETIKLRAERDLMFKAHNDEKRVILGNQTEQIGGDETITIGDMTIGAKSPGGNFTLNALETVTINVGPKGSPVAQIVMTMTGITFNYGPQGTLAQIVMGPTGVTVSGTPASQFMVQPTGIMTMTPMMNLLSDGPITFVSPMVTIPTVTIGAGTASGLPLI